MKRTIVADLHNHSTESDGEYTPEALVEAACNLGLQAVALTDHDTMNGLNAALAAGQHTGIQVIPGIEVTLRFRRPIFVGSLHLLLYFSETLLHTPDFRDAVQEVLGKGRGPALVRDRVDAINAEFGPDGQEPLLQRPLTAEEVMAYSTNVTRRHFALALQEHHGLQEREEVNRLIGNDSPAYIPSGIDMAHLKPLVDRFPVVQVFAHPAAGSFPGPGHYKEVLPPLSTIEQLLPEFLDPATLGIDGLEVYYPGHTDEHRELLLEWARQHGLIVTGGSDCHDTTNRPPGVAGVTRAELDALLECIHAAEHRAT
jgi:hypothetical protein